MGETMRCITALLILCSAISAQSKDKDKDKGKFPASYKVNVSSSYLLTDPDSTAIDFDLNPLKNGDKVTIVMVQSGYGKLKTSDGKDRWIDMQDLVTEKEYKAADLKAEKEGAKAGAYGAAKGWGYDKKTEEKMSKSNPKYQEGVNRLNAWLGNPAEEIDKGCANSAHWVGIHKMWFDKKYRAKTVKEFMNEGGLK